MQKAFLIFLVFLCGLLHSATITSTVCGAWSNPSTWNLNRLPLASDTIVVETFVAYDQDFMSSSPGLLMVAPCGTLCGEHNYQGRFEFSGVVYLGKITVSYGSSYSYTNSILNVKEQVNVINTGTGYYVTGFVCVGCTSPCQNCLTGAKTGAPCAAAGLENVEITDLLVYPNPATEILYLKNTIGYSGISLYNSLGTCVRELTITGELTLDLLPSGIYFLHADKNGIKVIRKILVNTE